MRVSIGARNARNQKVGPICRASSFVFTAENEDGRFGATGILLEDCAEEALPYFEAMLTNPVTREEARRLREINMGESRNRSRIIGKSVEQVEADFERWSSIAAGIAEKTE